MKKYKTYKVEMTYKGVLMRTFYVDAENITHARNKAKKNAVIVFSEWVVKQSKFYVNRVI